MFFGNQNGNSVVATDKETRKWITTLNEKLNFKGLINVTDWPAVSI